MTSFGAEIQRWSFGAYEIALHEDGFHGRGLAGEASGRWDDVVALRRAHVVQTIAAWDRKCTRIELVTTSGARFVAEGSDPGLIGLGVQLAEIVSPRIVARTIEQIERGETVAFAPDLRVSARGIEVIERGAWQLLAPADIAGYRVNQGHCLIDHNPARPELRWKPYLGAIDNPDAFVAIVERFAPGRNLEHFTYRVPTAARTAATHDPRVVGLAPRLKIAGVAALVLVAGGGAMFYAKYTGQRAGATPTPTETAREVREAAERDDATDLLAAAVPATALAEACSGQPINLKHMIVVFVARPDEVTAPAMFPAYVTSDATHWSRPFPRREDLMGHKSSELVVARAVADTEIKPGAQSRARLFARVFEVAGHRLRCEGVVEGNWTTVRAFNDFDTSIYVPEATGLVKVLLRGLCTGSKDGPCDAVTSDWDGIRLAPMSPPPKKKRPRA